MVQGLIDPLVPPALQFDCIIDPNLYYAINRFLQLSMFSMKCHLPYPSVSSLFSLEHVKQISKI
jgi:hypothetical protein